MSNHLNRGLLIGAGPMALEYAKVLQALEIEFEVIGRGEESAAKFERESGVSVKRGGIEEQKLDNDAGIQFAIIASSVSSLCENTLRLLQTRIPRILVEKPAAGTFAEIEKLKAVWQARQTKEQSVFVAYNRRFLESVQRAKRWLNEDGGPVSFTFEFTEWAHRLEMPDIPEDVRRATFLANSTHIMDLAFFLGGSPVELNGMAGGSLEWHPEGARFVGVGKTEARTLFSYYADWQAPGRWGAEIMSRERRFILRPLEQLQIQKKGSVAIEMTEAEDKYDSQYKPGLWRQLAAFLRDENEADLCSLDEHLERCQLYATIQQGGEWRR